MSENFKKNEELEKYEKLAEENRSLDKFRGSDIVKWAVKLKHDKETAKKYEGVSTVQEILKKAREDGFNFTEKELLDFNLDLVAGGEGVGNMGDVGSGNTTGDIDASLINVGDKKKEIKTGENTNTNTSTMGATSNGNQNQFNFGNTNTANQS